MQQFELNFNAGLTDQFPAWSDVVSESVYGCGKPFKNIAADLDLSSSMLSRMLNPNDSSVNFPIQRFADLVVATGDHRPIFWLVERFCQDGDAQRKRSLNRLASLLPELEALVRRETSGDVVEMKRGAR